MDHAHAAVSKPGRISHGKQVACLNCRRSKIRCNRDQNELPCDRCKQSNLECIVPSYHVGRQKGVKNKRTGLEKALYQIEQAIKRPRSEDAAASDAAHRVISNLQELLGKAQDQQQVSHSETDDFSENPDQTHSLSSPREQEDSLALDDAENPLQLLARASDLQLSPAETQKAPVPSRQQPAISRTQDHDSGANSFFVPVRASRDVGPELDPIDLGLVTMEEAESLFSFFYQNLAHTRWGLDPLIHTVSFVRTQSAFLFTSILAATTLFLSSAAALSKRLFRHCRSLANTVAVQRHRSVEIVLAFMVNVPWMAPGNCLGDDDACAYIAMALTVALDLSLNKIVVPSSSFDNSILKRLAKADCVNAKRALHMDGFDDVDAGSEWGRRLLRRRERAWIALFVLERGVCLARGRSYTVPPTTLVENCDHWHISDIADSRDGPMNSMAVLRRNLDEIFRKVKSNCDNYQVVDTGPEAAQSIKTMIESFYDRWYATWAPAIGEGQSLSLPPYVDILVTHTRLSTYAGVINHATAPIEVKRFFRAAALSSALNVLRAAIQGEARLKSMPNNTVIMISFAACSALSLSVTPGDSRSSLAPSVRNLIEETAGVLERIGATPSHRHGASVLYGRFLRELIRRAPVGSRSQNHFDQRRAMGSTEALQPVSSLDAYDPIVTTAQPSASPSLLWMEPLQFSAMSDDQIIDAVNRAGTAFGTTVPDVPFDDMLRWDWLDFANNGSDFNL
ncbi:hypothetical protein SI65_07495 [Aspergillus cristatus]|uniref:Zn(2)-C6 fungal-type domain-containing protein n=1 Tax=Aspergillus cristatus TaxID=573508 RepID=A0A1E3B9M0_ASPCR|nr:hypothetical protein SI65_07495 [Aspergillus cristatus]